MGKGSTMNTDFTKPAIETTPVPGTQASPATPESDTIETIIRSARASFDSDYVPVASCMDWLLDCYNLADESVKALIASYLPDYANGNLRKTADIEAAFDAIELSLTSL